MPQSSLNILRETIATLESRPQSMSETGDLSVMSNTDSAISLIDRLENGALTEIIPSGYRDRIAALGKVMASLAALTKATDERIIWCQLRDPDRLHLHAPGLTAFGIDPKRITKMTLLTERDLLWVMEEAVASGSVGAVAGVLWSEKYYDFTASKRLRMRARETDTALWCGPTGPAGPLPPITVCRSILNRALAQCTDLVLSASSATRPGISI